MRHRAADVERLRLRQGDTTATLVVEGPLDECGPILEALAARATPGARLDVDLAGCPFTTARGMAAIARCRTTATGTTRQVGITNPSALVRYSVLAAGLGALLAPP